MTMHPSSLDAYHETEVFTASPQRLRVMLIDGAIRALQTTKQHWAASEFELGGKSMEMRLRDSGRVAGGDRSDADG